MDPILATIERSNQRGGRMLSVVDLIETDTLDAHRAAWLITRIERGSSFFVGAKPGGAGKTTVMGALLAHLPEGEAVRLTNPDTGWEDSHPGDCVVAYEIGRGSYDAYAWGADVARMGELARTGVRVVTNLHADTLEQACGQIVDDCGASPEGFEALGIFIPLEIKGTAFSARRRVGEIRHRGDGTWRALGQRPSPTPRETAIEAFLLALRKNGVVRIEEVRRQWLDWRRENPLSD